jgi:hypothetical protein
MKRRDISTSSLEEPAQCCPLALQTAAGRVSRKRGYPRATLIQFSGEKEGENAGAHTPPLRLRRLGPSLLHHASSLEPAGNGSDASLQALTLGQLPGPATPRAVTSNSKSSASTVTTSSKSAPFCHRSTGWSFASPCSSKRSPPPRITTKRYVPTLRPRKLGSTAWK